MPTNATGPASDTAAPVASDALIRATRSLRRTSTPRAAADYARTAAFAVLFVATLLFLDRSQDFIYFRF